MTHNVSVSEVKQLNNENVAYCLTCCDDPLETSWHTIHILSADHDAQLELQKPTIIQRHEAMVRWRAKHKK
jgi:hypothetical protein